MLLRGFIMINTYLSIKKMSILLVIISMLLMMYLLSINEVYSQQEKNSSIIPFENISTNQHTTNGNIESVPSIGIIVELVNDSDGFGIIGEPYKPQYNLIWISFEEHGKSTSNFYPLTDSGINRVEVSDTKIHPSFSYKVPIGPNNTTESIEKIGLFFDINYITKLPDGLNYVGTTDVPIMVNNSEYRDLYLDFDQYNNGTANLVLIGYQTPGPM